MSTVTITGAELKAFLENGVSGLPATDGRLPEVSGLCFTYDITQNAGSRVIPSSVVTTDSAGNCTTTTVDLTAGSTYKIAENDFMAAGGNGYPVTTGKPDYATQGIMDQVLADYLTANDPVNPFVKAAPDGRINCFHGAGPLPGNVCPVVVASPPVP